MNPSEWGPPPPFVPFHSSSFRSIRLTAVTGVDERNEQTRAAVT